MLETRAPRTPANRSAAANLLRSLRKLHLYSGLFIAPALMFFAFTGAVQTLSLHEGAGDSYQAPKWLAELSQVHKDQTLEMHKGPPPSAQNRPAASAASPGPSPSAAARPAAQPAPSGPARPPMTLRGKQRQHLPLKVFFLLVCAGLLASTSTGIYMAYTYERSKLLVTSLLVAGLLIPLVLLRF